MAFVVVIAMPVVFALLLALTRGRLAARWQGWLLAAALAVCFGIVIVLGAQTPITQLSLDWMPQIGLSFSLYVDGLALLFALVITGVGSGVMLYAGYYFDDGREAARFLVLLLLFTSSMLLLVMAGNVLTLFIAWELTSILSFLLISFKGYEADARAGASRALIITGGGGLALLVGLLLMGAAAGTTEIGALLSSGDVLREHPWYSAIAVLIMIGCFSKSAQFPLHFWLPGAMSAPTPASAFLHSATMVKAGVYLLARFSPALGDTALWEAGLVGIGLFTMLLGAWLALFQRDLKGMLAYSTVSQLGALIALIGLPEGEGLKAALIGILAHALYKGALFLVVGTVDHANGTRDIEKLGGLRSQMPALALFTALLALSMAGFPPLFGFVAKETLLEAFLAQPVALVVIVLSATFTAVLALRLFWDVFMGAPVQDDHAPEAHNAHDDHAHHHAPTAGLAVTPGGLAAASVIGGLGISSLIAPLISAAVGKPISLYLFPPGGINLAFMLSMGVLVSGVALFLIRGRWLRWKLPTFPSGAQVYRGAIGLVEGAGDLLLRSQGGKIRYYLVFILFAAALLLATVIVPEISSLQRVQFDFNGVTDVLKVVLLALSLVATLASILFNNHLIAALALGAAGYAVGGLFLLEPAPDVALVQFLVETLVSVLIIVILARTSDEERHEAMQRLWSGTRTGIGRDVILSLAMGALVAVFALSAVSNRPTPDAIAQWHLDNALPQVGVTDVVAGIITDFRGTDTLIEIFVFGMAGLGVLTMLAYRHPQALKADEELPPSDVSGSKFSDPITRWVANIVLPLALLIAAGQLLYAGSAPGDGFTAGVIAGLGITLSFVVLGYETAKQRLRWLRPAPLIGMGLIVALTNALLPLIFGREFFAFTQIVGINIAEIKLASSLLFEVGIFLTVLGGIGAVMEAISHPKEVEPL